MSELDLQFESNPDAPGAARRHLQSIRSDLEPRFDDVLIVVSELVANSVRHSECRDLDLNVKTDRDQIRVEVTDCGPGIATVANRGNGLGLQIVDRVAEEWGFVAEPRFTIWAEFSKV